MRGVLECGEASWSEDLLLVVERYGYREEAYFTYSYSPIKHADGTIGGVFSAVNETTARVLGERRLRIHASWPSAPPMRKARDRLRNLCRCAGRRQPGPAPDRTLSHRARWEECTPGCYVRLHAWAGASSRPDRTRLKRCLGGLRVICTGHPILLSDLAERFGRLPGRLAGADNGRSRSAGNQARAIYEHDRRPDCGR